MDCSCSAKYFHRSKSRAAKPAQAKLAVSAALKLSISKPAGWSKNFKQALADAAWYEINFEKEIDSALWKMTYKELEVLKKRVTERIH